MRNAALIRFPSLRVLCAFSLVLGLASFGIGLSAHAETNPFDISDERWTKPKSYQPLNTTPPEATPPEATPPAPEAKTAPAPLQPFALSPIPSLPAPNKSFDIHLSSTDEHNKDKPPAVKESSPTDVQLSDKNWKTPAAQSAPKDYLDDDESGNEQETTALNVRMSFLPAQNLTPIPEPAHESAHTRGNAQRKNILPPNQSSPLKTPEESAACAALDAYKKQQLDAIQSDRETLKALQDAVHALGKTKELNFMTERDSPLNDATAQAPTTTPMPISAR